MTDDPQDVAESFDEDKLDDDSDDPAGSLDFPPEEPMGLEPDIDDTEPDVLPPDDRPLGRLIDSEGPLGADDEPDAVATLAEEEGDLSAEEAAMHLTDDPAMGEPGDGYI